MQSTRRPQHFCFARTELIPPQILVQALSTSFEKTCKSRLRGEFFQDVVLATYVSRLFDLSVPFVEYRAQVWPRLGLAGARLGASSTSINDLHHVLRGPPKAKKKNLRKKIILDFFCVNFFGKNGHTHNSFVGTSQYF